jgi:hypothetical protein
MLLGLHSFKVSGQFYAVVVLPTRNVGRMWAECGQNVGRTMVGPPSWCGLGVEEINAAIVGHGNPVLSTLRLLVLCSLILKNYLKDFNGFASSTAGAHETFLI